MLLGKNKDILIGQTQSDEKKTIKLIKGYLKYEFVSIIIIDVLLKIRSLQCYIQIYASFSSHYFCFLMYRISIQYT